MNTSMPMTLILALAFAPSIVLAQAREEGIPDVVKVGQPVSVVDERGRKVEGRVEEVSEHGLRVSRRAGTEEIPIDRIVRIDRPDSLKNGALIGLTIGVGVGVFGGVMDPQSDQHVPFVIVSTIGNALIWTALGVAVDAIFDHRRTLYERGRPAQARVSPIIGRGVRGAALSVTW